MVYFINALNLQYLYNIVANLVLLESFSKHLKLLEEHDCTIDNQRKFKHNEIGLVKKLITQSFHWTES